jgi:hypothetical protein
MNAFRSIFGFVCCLVLPGCAAAPADGASKEKSAAIVSTVASTHD